MKLVVAFGHRTGEGKDTAGKMLVQEARIAGKMRRVVRTSFANLLKNVSFMLYGCHGLMPPEFYEEEGNWAKKDDVLPNIGKTARQVWIEVGSSMRAIYEHTWRDAALAVPADLLVITDMRFPNEADAVKAMGGVTVKVENSRAKDWHKMDFNLKDYAFDEVIENEGTLSELSAKVQDFAKRRGIA